MIIPFPINKQPELTEEHLERIEKFAKEYVALLHDIANEMLGDNPTNEYVDQVMQVVLTKLVTAFNDALSNETEL